MKLQIVAAILLVTILSPKRSSAEQVIALDHETPFEEAVGVFPHPAGGGFAPVFQKYPAGKRFPLLVNGAMICGLRIRNY
ncbi:unnamed protein product [Natator depressus]